MPKKLAALILVGLSLAGCQTTSPASTDKFVTDTLRDGMPPVATPASTDAKKVFPAAPEAPAQDAASEVRRYVGAGCCSGD